ncbi:MAG TPA: malto-oligosyltrehalose trehalohydrolase [Acidimicrobiales bacterium]|nr:malto-oligosyltrehalose trehalohydrolase [Acidimicrobiales bacterium]
MGRLTVWAPRASRVRLWSRQPEEADAAVEEMVRGDRGWWWIETRSVAGGRDYGFLLDDGEGVLPDPRARWQPQGVEGPSRFWRDEAPWSDEGWNGRDLAGAVFYELHVGTFSAEGTFDGVVGHLDHLVELGVTHVELLPVNDFNGSWNWGYDGALWYAVHEAYGGPDGLHRLVDACHRRGLAVVLDVVYNHLSSDGNVLPRFGPYLKSGANTWGEHVNLDETGAEEVRAYILDNACSWLTDFHIDGLRLDAVHALSDSSPRHVLAELSERVGALEHVLGRRLLLIAESDLNDPITWTPVADGGWGLDAQWDDDVHHCLHALLTGERQGYYVDFGSIGALAKVLRHAFFHDGTYSAFRGRVHGRQVSPATTGRHLLGYLQDHDQVGNRAGGDRLSALTSRSLLEVGMVLLLASPFVPMLFMGEEWGASSPWPFFTSHPDAALGEEVRDGRIAEFAAHGWDVETMPDPQDPATFAHAKLDWGELLEEGHLACLSRYRELLRLRREHPELQEGQLDNVVVTYDEEQRWIAVRREGFDVLANFSDEEQEIPTLATEIVLATGAVSLRQGHLRVAARSAVIGRRRDR